MTSQIYQPTVRTHATNPSAQAAGFSQNTAVAHLKHQLQHDYEEAYPGLGEIIHLVLDEEEAKARALSVFPHLLLPDLVEEHIAKLGLHPVLTRPENITHALAA